MRKTFGVERFFKRNNELNQQQILTIVGRIY
jgi:hypothetical protein